MQDRIKIVIRYLSRQRAPHQREVPVLGISQEEAQSAYRTTWPASPILHALLFRPLGLPRPYT